MKSVKRFLVLTILTVCLAVSALGGDIPGPPLPPPPNGQSVVSGSDSIAVNADDTAIKNETLSNLLVLILQLTVGR